MTTPKTIKYKLTAINAAGNRVTLANCDSLSEAHRLWSEYRTTRGLRYKDIGIQYP